VMIVIPDVIALWLVMCHAQFSDHVHTIVKQAKQTKASKQGRSK
jgi:hypothetical protein